MSQKELSEAPLNCCHLALLGDELLLIFEHAISTFPKTGVLCRSFPDEITPGIQKAAILYFRFLPVLFYSSYKGHHSSVKFYPTFERPPKRIHTWPRPTFAYQLPHLQTGLMIMNCELKEHLRDIELYLGSPHDAVLPFADLDLDQSTPSAMQQTIWHSFLR